MGFTKYGDYDKWANKNSFKKQIYKNNVTYQTSYEILTYEITEENVTNIYAYTSYVFSYVVKGFDSTTFVSAFDFIKKPHINLLFATNISC